MNFRKYDYQTFDDLIDYRHVRAILILFPLSVVDAALAL